MALSKCTVPWFQQNTSCYTYYIYYALRKTHIALPSRGECKHVDKNVCKNFTVEEGGGGGGGGRGLQFQRDRLTSQYDNFICLAVTVYSMQYQ